MSKISELEAINSVGILDVIPIVDETDNTTKKATPPQIVSAYLRHKKLVSANTFATVEAGYPQPFASKLTILRSEYENIPFDDIVSVTLSTGAPVSWIEGGSGIDIFGNSALNGLHATVNIWYIVNQ